MDVATRNIRLLLEIKLIKLFAKKCIYSKSDGWYVRMRIFKKNFLT